MYNDAEHAKKYDHKARFSGFVILTCEKRVDHAGGAGSATFVALNPTAHPLGCFKEQTQRIVNERKGRI
ncbi:hypothetical protein [Desulfonema ishimotonii]|uniref:hypothetical protein n=1 Tax=Desulfonema ishimotonii TaxID=45657 RepID=UPI000F574E09|nr:hypothetical protein [Desulfonema ishimotonii]